jgi:hypothetical protein
MAVRAKGKVSRLYVRAEATNIRLEIPQEEQPLENYFKLETTHPNYNALYSLALSAAVNTPTGVRDLHGCWAACRR